MVCEDVTTVKELSERFEHEATHDALTGLVNRREIDRRLRELADGGEPLSLCIIDLDHFKRINDTHGHHAGDVVLVELAHMLSGMISSRDVLGRTGGDEMLLLLPGCRLSNAVRVAERLRTAVHNLDIPEAGGLKVTLSIGVASLERSGDVTALLADADEACYAAKSAGRDRISVVRQTRASNATSDVEWVDRVQRALNDNNLDLVAHEVRPIARGQAEPLTPQCRSLLETLPWLAVSMVLVEDDRCFEAQAFSSVVERYGLSVTLDRWLMTEVIATVGVLERAAGSAVSAAAQPIAVQISMRSAESEEFREFVIEALSRSGVMPSRFIFEINGSLTVNRFHSFMGFIEALGALGCRFVLQDLGVGLSSLRRLRSLPILALKLSAELAGGAAADEDLMRGLISMATALRIGTIIECVEETVVPHRLYELGADVVIVSDPSQASLLRDLPPPARKRSGSGPNGKSAIEGPDAGAESPLEVAPRPAAAARAKAWAAMGFASAQPEVVPGSASDASLGGEAVDQQRDHGADDRSDDA